MIASGWWSCPTGEDDRSKVYGDDSIRDISFHYLWRECIDRFTDPSEIMVIDSDSPKKPEEIRGEKWLSMSKNFGHSTNHSGQFSGYTRAIFLSMMYAYANDFDYWVYIEQDALIYGDRIIEKSIAESKHGVVYGSGKGTPQQIQQSFMIFNTEAIPDFINNYVAINKKDKIISPEWKFLFAQNRLATILPLGLLRWLTKTSKNQVISWVRWSALRFLRKFDQFDTFDFGFGRSRPIKFSDSHFYFQHGNEDEVQAFKKKLANIGRFNDHTP